MTGPDPIRIAMWSGPRNISTAMMRAFENRPDTFVIDEPFYGAYLAATGLDHPLRNDVLASQPADWRDVVQNLRGPVPAGRSIFYQKHMTHHMLPDIGRDWMAQCRNVFLIRAPADVLRSYRARRDSVTLDDLGFRQQAELFDMASDLLGTAPPVIDAADVLAAPEATLKVLCAALEISFLPQMLHWPAGQRATDGVWAPAWYQAVQQSTGFAPQPGPSGALDDHLTKIAEAAEPYYARMIPFRLQGQGAALDPLGTSPQTPFI
jgi:hypothetical protein